MDHINFSKDFFQSNPECEKYDFLELCFKNDVKLRNDMILLNMKVIVFVKSLKINCLNRTKATLII